MNRLSKVFAFILAVVVLTQCGHHVENEKWKKIFEKYDAKGTFVLKNLSDNRMTVYNEKRSDSLYLPASTFKVLNSMIALQTSAIGSVDDTIKWDGEDKGWALWNRDHTMRSAMPVSCVWFYQDLAKRIGKEKMQLWINKVNYGNRNIEKKIDDFWLKGDLRITAKEQVAFIEKLIYNQLPFDDQIQEIVKEIMITDSTDTYTIHSKTGWAKKIGWNVGYVQSKNNQWIFGMNMDLDDIKNAKFRKIITYEILRLEKIIE